MAFQTVEGFWREELGFANEKTSQNAACITYAISAIL